MFSPIKYLFIIYPDISVLSLITGVSERTIMNHLQGDQPSRGVFDIYVEAATLVQKRSREIERMLFYQTPIKYLSTRLTTEDISQACGMSVRTVRNHISGARQPGRKHRKSYYTKARDMLENEVPSRDKGEKRVFKNFKQRVIKRWERQCL